MNTTADQSESSFTRRVHFRLWGVIGLLSIHSALLAWNACIHNPTLNEPGHLVAGIGIWDFGGFEIYNVNPPLVRMVAAIPVELAGAQTNWTKLRDGPGARSEFLLGEDFVAANGYRSFWLFTLARWVCIPFSLIGACCCYRWASELYNYKAGLFALALWCFCPNILGHGSLITPDVAATSLGFVACYTFWHWLKFPSWPKLLISGVCLGLAELTKMTLVVLFPLWITIWFIYRWSNWRADQKIIWRRDLAMLVIQILVAFYIINLGYEFKGTGIRLREFKFVSTALGAQVDPANMPSGGGNRFTNSWLGEIPVMLPADYVLGIDLQKRDFEHYGHPSYLRGEFSEKGWWYYYLYALAIKVPLGTWILVGLAASRGIWRRRKTAPLPQLFSDERRSQITWRDEFVLLCPAVVILAFVSSQCGFSEHMRYVLPAFPFIFVWIGRIVQFLGRQHRIATGVAIVALTWSIGSSLSVYPHSLSYFNELVGGPTGGPNHLIQSNVDWGQDLLFLKKWLDQHPEARPLKLAYFGYFDPRYAGIDYEVPENVPAPEEIASSNGKIAPGWYAVSVNFVRGFPYFAYRGFGSKIRLKQNALAAFQQLKPVTMAGYSIYIYHVTDAAN